MQGSMGSETVHIAVLRLPVDNDIILDDTPFPDMIFWTLLGTLENVDEFILNTCHVGTPKQWERVVASLSPSYVEGPPQCMFRRWSVLTPALSPRYDEDPPQWLPESELRERAAATLAFPQITVNQQVLVNYIVTTGGPAGVGSQQSADVGGRRLGDTHRGRVLQGGNQAT